MDRGYDTSNCSLSSAANLPSRQGRVDVCCRVSFSATSAKRSNRRDATITRARSTERNLKSNVQHMGDHHWPLIRAKV